SDGDLIMYRGLIDGNAQGGCVFIYLDGWWKNNDIPDDADTHEPEPEEWFGLWGIVDETSDPNGTARPAWYAMKQYNMGIITSPKNGQIYDANIPLEFFLDERVDSIRVKRGQSTLHEKYFTYGRMEARIKLPQGGQGIWPAFWMLGETFDGYNWPTCGEIDIMERINNDPNIYATIHYGTNIPSYSHMKYGGSYIPGVDPSADYHIYAIEWGFGIISWYFDDINYLTLDWWPKAQPWGPSWPEPFTAPEFFLVNIAVG
ncbi:unnamed protein product, partial [marine sediment metagenome]